MSVSQRFSLVAFRFKTGYDDVYIHCKLTVCLSDELESKCTKGCQDGENDSRKKREVKEDYGADLFIGPIKIKEEKDEGNLRKQLKSSGREIRKSSATLRKSSGNLQKC